MLDRQWPRVIAFVAFKDGGMEQSVSWPDQGIQPESAKFSLISAMIFFAGGVVVDVKLNHA